MLDLWSYTVGLYEGKGWATIKRHRNRHQVGEYATLGIAMRDPAPLLLVQRTLNGGHVSGPYARHGGGVVEPGDYRPRYVLLINRRVHIDPFLEWVFPHLSPEKQDQIRIVMGKDSRKPAWSEPT